MALLTALGFLAGGYGQGRQQRYNNQLLQQQQATNQGYEDIAAQEWKAKQRTILQNQGINPDTGQPYQLPPGLGEVAPNNHGKAASDAQTLDHLYKLAQFYRQTGQTDAATDAVNRAYALENDIRANRALQVRTMLDYFNQNQQNQRTADTIAGALQRNQNTVGGADDRNQATINALLTRALINADQSNTNNIRTTQTSSQNNIRSVTERYTSQAQGYMKTLDQENAAALKAWQAKNPGQTTPPVGVLPHPNLDAFKQGLSYAISQVSQNPKALQKMLKSIDAHAKEYEPAMLTYAHQVLENAARDAQAAAQGGGSQAEVNPPSSPWP